MKLVSRLCRLPFQVHLSTAFIFLVVFVGLTLGGIAFVHSKNAVNELTEKTFERIANEAILSTKDLFSAAEVVVDLLSSHDISQAMNRPARLKHITLLIQALNNSSNITSVYIGYNDGDFLLLRRLPDEASLQKRFAPIPPGTHYIAQHIDRSKQLSLGSYVYLDAQGLALEKREQADYGRYDPRTRPWFKQAKNTPEQIKSKPYVFFTTGEIGTTVARKTADGRAIVAADITLQTLAAALNRFKLSPGTEVVLVNDEGQLLAHPDATKVLDGQDPPSQVNLNSLPNPVLWQAFRAHQRGLSGTRIGEETFNSEKWRSLSVSIPLRGGQEYTLVLASPARELLADVNAMMLKTLLWLGLSLILFLFFSVLLARQVASPINRLTQASKAIRQFDFSQDITINSLVADIDDLAVAMNDMKATIRQFLDISQMLAAEKDFDLLQRSLLDETILASRAEGGVLYLLNDEETRLSPTAIRGKGRKAINIGMPTLAMDKLHAPIDQAVAKAKVCSSSIDGAQAASQMPQGMNLLLSELDTQGNLVAVPLFNRQRDLVGILCLIINETLETSHLSFVAALSSIAAVSFESRKLIDEQKNLLDSVILSLAGAIDAKSPYTGGHCERVPLLTLELAQAAIKVESGPFKDFELSADELNALNIAAWLHDCGKVTTPDYVVDKATKLETNYDRLHEIRMRFEVLKRDADITYWQGLADGGQPEVLEQERRNSLAKIDDDFNFIATCNVGSEFLSDEQAQRIKQIAAQSWLRTLDDRLGLSQAELERKGRSEPQPLPAREPLLADKPEHQIERSTKDEISEDNPWGFKLKVPRYLYDRGELHNLLIQSGTLTAEERYKINEHIVQTIKILEQLPFPKHLQAVPELAGGHHEKMNGNGYPRGLKRDEMSIQARMMAIADIYEALTAGDRPYKKGKSLSAALEIMAKMSKEGHIDPEIFELFLRSGVYKHYAYKFMQSDKVDKVDIEDYL